MRLIDAERLMGSLATIAANCARSDAQKALMGRVMYNVEKQPTVYAAEVVRCRDCIHWQEPFDSNNIGYLVAHCDMFKDGDAFHERFYCAHGERRDEDATN